MNDTRLSVGHNCRTHDTTHDTRLTECRTYLVEGHESDSVAEGRADETPVGGKAKLLRKQQNSYENNKMNLEEQCNLKRLKQVKQD